MRPAFSLLFLLVVIAGASPAYGYDWQVSAETVGQGYQVRRLLDDGQTEMLSRRRLIQDLGLGVYNLVPWSWTNEGRENQVFFVTRFRFESDFGSYPARAAREQIPELERYNVTWLYGYLGVNDLFGRLDLRLGRQISMDFMDFFAFDGLSMRLRLPWYVLLEAHGGAAVLAEWPLASPIFQLDGTSRHNRVAETRPELQDAPAASVGAALETAGIRDVFARIGYRATLSVADKQLEGEGRAAFLDEHISFQAQASFFRGRLQPAVGVRWDFLGARVDQAEASLRGEVVRNHKAVVEYLHAAPTFDGDSIFNVFATRPLEDVRVGWDYEKNKVAAYGRGFVRFLKDESMDSVRWTLDAGGAAGVAVSTGRGRVRCDAYYEDGAGGLRAGADLRGRYALVPGWLFADGRTTLVVSWPGHSTEERIGEPSGHTSFGVEGGLWWTPARALAVHVIGYGNLSSIEHSLGFFALVEMQAWLFETFRKGQR